jgi:hypothetical protein
MNVGGGRHGWVTQRAGAITIQANFRRDSRNSGRLAFRTDHGKPQVIQAKGKYQTVLQASDLI